ncbi:divergent polysaccharide deacetylase family protein [Paenibacillus sp. CC-CFT747]|nr:divergent polysaccharide deacetylase family protein [Paenibacillus sp. CC-CFT747]
MKWISHAGKMVLCALALGAALAFPAGKGKADPVSVKKAAIIIDDFGNNLKGTKEMMELPVPFTAAVMPFLPTTKRDAEWAHRLGHDVLVHLPMEPVKGKKSWLGPNPITTDLSDEEIRKRVEAAIDDVPYAIGMNNHMGSKATADERVMKIVLQVCRERQLLFFDSRTSYRSQVPVLAKQLGVRTEENQLFFDDVYSRSHIIKQLALFKKKLDQNRVCTAIGHVGVSGVPMAEELKKTVLELSPEVTFLTLSEFIAVKTRGNQEEASPESAGKLQN